METKGNRQELKENRRKQKEPKENARKLKGIHGNLGKQRTEERKRKPEETKGILLLCLLFFDLLLLSPLLGPLLFLSRPAFSFSSCLPFSPFPALKTTIPLVTNGGLLRWRKGLHFEHFWRRRLCLGLARRLRTCACWWRGRRPVSHER